MQYVPVDGIYTYFRYDNDKTVMVVVNSNAKPSTLNLSRFKERIQDKKSAINIIDKQVINLASDLNIPAKTTLVLELQ